MVFHKKDKYFQVEYKYCILIICNILTGPPLHSGHLPGQRGRVLGPLRVLGCLVWDLNTYLDIVIYLLIYLASKLSTIYLIIYISNTECLWPVSWTARSASSRSWTYPCWRSRARPRRRSQSRFWGVDKFAIFSWISNFIYATTEQCLITNSKEWEIYGVKLKSEYMRIYNSAYASVKCWGDL